MSESEPAPRKIIHVDMDAFYASVEQRDDATLRGKPVVVAWRGMRSVVCAASYEARKFGIRSAMPAVRAERLCPDAIFVPPDFTRYRAASQHVRSIFLRYTPLVEPLSLDEAYLDVTDHWQALGSATAVAQSIREAIRAELSLTASAGVAPNKFIAKIASDWRKPDGIFVVRPHEVEDFLEPLEVSRIPGVGRVMDGKLAALGVRNIGHLRALPLAMLEQQFGRYGARLYELARGIDHNLVRSERPTKSISAEDTFEQDLPLSEIAPHLPALAEKVWKAARRENRPARTVVLKLKTSDFHNLTRSFTPASPPDSLESFLATALSLLQRVELPEETRYRLAGVGLSHFVEEETLSPQPQLF